MPIAFLYAMQAAGMVTDFFGTLQQQELNDLGAKLQQAGIEANINQTRLETEEQSLQALVKLRKTLGTQLAIFGARGTNPGQGSAFSLLNESISNSNADERIRRMNELAQETSLRGQGLISKLNNSSGNSNLWQGFASRTINKFGTSSLGNGSSGASAFSGSKASAYGLTQQAGT